MASTSTGMTRLTNSFPFGSKYDNYDDKGYPIYDRAVGATTLKDVFAKFFTNGVFPNPSTALQIGKADTGLAVTIQPGIGIINGAMGGVEGDAMMVQLDTASPQGNVAYSIMLRYDNTDSFADSRSLLINVVRSDAATTPTPPEPDTTSPEVYELRLGYVVVPSGATDLSSATVTNEKGLAVCPFAAPFEEIDVEGIVSDFKVSANEALTNLLAYYEANKAAIDAALDDSAATYLQTQINQIKEELDNFDLSGSVDNVTVEYATAAGEASPRLRVKGGGIGTAQLADSSVTMAKLAQDVLDRILPTIGDDLGSYSWSDLIWMIESGKYEPSDFAYMVGQVKPVDISGYGSQNFVLIGTGHDDIVGGGKAFLTFQSQNIVLNRQVDTSSNETSSAGWGTCACRTWLNSTFKNAFPSEIGQAMKTVVKTYMTYGNRMGGSTSTSNDDVFIASINEIKQSYSIEYDDGTRYDYWSSHTSASDLIKKLGSSNKPWWTRSMWDGDGTGLNYYLINTNGAEGGDLATDQYGIVPCFCI